MKKLLSKKTGILILILLLLSCLLVIYAMADAGSFSGSSDYGGGGGWSGGSDYSSDWGSSGYSSGDSGEFSFSSVISIIFVVLIIIFFAAKKKGTGISGSTPAGAAPTSSASLSPVSTLLDEDPNFSEAKIKEKVANLYVQMQNSWQDKDFEPMRAHMTDALYSQFARQLDDIAAASCTNYVERIAVLDVNITGWMRDDVNDSLVAIINTRIVDYTVNDKTGKLVSGSRTAEKFMCYEWTLVRSKGMQTPAPSGNGSEGISTIHCPSCGAPVEINQSAKCPYCDSIISAKDYDWVISSIKGISQRTVG